MFNPFKNERDFVLDCLTQSSHLKSYDAMSDAHLIGFFDRKPIKRYLKKKGFVRILLSRFLISSKRDQNPSPF